MNLSPKTIKNVHGILHKALEQALKLRYIGMNPADYCTLPRMEKKEIQPLKETELAAFLSVIREGKPLRDLMGAAWLNHFGLVFTNPDGRYIMPQTAFKRFKKAAEKVGRPDARFHDLRHTYAVISLQEGDDIKTVQQNLGHATASFTLDVYGHVSEKMKQESADRMQSYFEKITD